MTSKTTKKRLILLDAHAILHRAYHALPDFTAPNGEPTGALYGVVSMVLKIVEDFQPDYMVACFDLPEPTYRHDAFAGYKAKREKTDDTLVSQIIRSRDIFAAFGIPIYEKVGFEADDLLGTIAFQTKEQKDLEIIIASGDMDTMQCVDGKRVQVYTLKKGIKDTILYDEAAVKERFGFPPKLVPDYKGLRGDTSDNIPGIVGIGEKTGTDLIVQFGGIDAIYKKLKKGEEAFLEAGIKPRIVKLLKEGEEEARFSKMLATIRIDVPVKFELPAKSWREEADPEKIITLFSELGFRTLGTRVRTALKLSPEAVIEASTAGVSNAEVHETGILLWLLESERTNPTFEDIVDYGRAYLETNNFADIKAKLLAKVEAEPGLKYVYEKIELPLQEAITTINKTGIALDVPYLKTLATEMHTELDALKLSIYEQAGMEFNINSPKQLGEVLFDALALKPKNQKKTAGGQRSTKESELEKLRDEHVIIPLLLRYRELQKLVSTYADTLPLQVSDDGRIRTTFLQTGTTTGRMGSRDPNLQNIPVRTKESIAIRRAFVADKGYTMVGIDYSQIELRIAAIMSHDEKLIDIFNRGEDVHTGVAVRVFGVDPSEVTSEMRRKAKVINFGILYGMGVNALRANLGGDTPREEAQQFLNAYFNTFTRLAEYLEETKQYARDNGYTETLFGRRRHFPGISSHAPFIRAQAERMAINAPIQGTAADVMRIAMNEVYGYLKESQKLGDIRMLLQVHDELVFEIKNELLDKEIPVLVGLMEGVMKGKESFGVPIKVDVAVGPNWADLEDKK
ncbi:MAG: polymerase protein [Parcubacteria group bacterium GW2011_GWF2_44_8]|nr:MAG: polymerase protein [Parcubacteria group bacterium GW2011_GWF2_44_8]